MLLGVCLLVSGRRGGSSPPGVADLGTSTATASEASATPSGRKANRPITALGFIGCLRTHGEPEMPQPTISKNGSQASIEINASSGLNPNAPQFAAATTACKHLLPDDGVPFQGHTLTPAERADYLKAVVCMRAHGISDLPDPTFQNDNLAFDSRTPIDANSPEYESALTTCQKLIPAGLPHSSSAARSADSAHLTVLLPAPAVAAEQPVVIGRRPA